MFAILVIVLLCAISQTYGFQMMRPSIVKRQSKPVAMSPMVDTVLTSNVDLMNQGLLVSDAGAVESIAAFAFIAVAIMVI